MIETSSDLPGKSSAITSYLHHLRKVSENVQKQSRGLMNFLDSYQYVYII